MTDSTGDPTNGDDTENLFCCSNLHGRGVQKNNYDFDKMSTMPLKLGYSKHSKDSQKIVKLAGVFAGLGLYGRIRTFLVKRCQRSEAGGRMR